MTESLLERLTSERKPLSVSQLTQQIKTLLETELADVWVQGEISNFKAHTSGHWYFTLKDAGAQLRSACFRFQNRLIRFKLRDGLEVFARGRISVYDKRGDYQLIVQYMEPVGIGSLQLAFEQLKTRLQAEGLFDPARKKVLPQFPRKVGVITSATGAAIRDILRVLQRRNSSVSVLIHPVQVQGQGAAEQIAAAIEVMNRRHDLDALIIGRGGGSIEDLWAFNEEVVARAVFASRIPTISAVGHETDFTISDFVADVRAPTPSAAAELVAARRDELLNRLVGTAQRLTQIMRLNLTTFRRRISDIQARRGFNRTIGFIQQYIQRIDDLDHRLQLAVAAAHRSDRDRLAGLTHRMAGLRLREFLSGQRGRVRDDENRLRAVMHLRIGIARRDLDTAAGKLETLNPLAVLARGYAIVSRPTGIILRHASEATPGDQLQVRLTGGRLTCIAKEVDIDD